MKRSDRLDMVQQMAARTERERAEKVGAAERHLVEMQQKLTALEKYRTEYEAGFKTRAGTGLDVIGMRDFQTFLAKLGEALISSEGIGALAFVGGRSNGRAAATTLADTKRRHFQTFLARLGEALAQQRDLVTLAQRALDAERSQWREAAQRQHVVETLAERWQGEETRAANRRDQNESDELSQQRATARKQTP